AAPADGDDHEIAEGDRARGVPVHQPRAAVVTPQLLDPERLAGLLVETLQAAGDAGREEPIADDQRRRVRAVAHLLRRVALERHRIADFPQRLAGLGAGRDDDFFLRAAVDRVEDAVLD